MNHKNTTLIGKNKIMRREMLFNVEPNTMVLAVLYRSRSMCFILTNFCGDKNNISGAFKCLGIGWINNYIKMSTTTFLNLLLMDHRFSP